MAIVTIGILAHVDAGKTSLTERILYETGVIRSVGRVDDGTTRTDTMDLERARGITIKSAVVAFRLGDLAVNLIDTPGHADFVAEVERALRVLDGVVLVVSAVEGVQPQTRRLVRAIRAANLPLLVFVNKIDRLGARGEPVLADLRRKLGLRVAAMNAPAGLGTRAARVAAVDRHDPDWQEATADLLAETNERVIEEFDRGGGVVDADFLRTELHSQFATGVLVPVFYGSAITGAGVGDLLAGVAEWLPPPAPSPEAPLDGEVFKIDRRPSGEKVVLARLFAGGLAARQQVAVGRGGPGGAERFVERVTGIDRIEPRGAVPVGAAHAGDVVALHGLRGARIGDRLGDGGAVSAWALPVALPAAFPAPALESVVRPVHPEQLARLRTALERLAEEDPLIALRQRNADGEISLRVFGEVQKEIVAATLAREHGIAVAFGATRAICIERPVGVGAHVEVIGEDGNPFYATIGLRVEPAAPGSGVRFEKALGALPLAFYRAVEETVHDALAQGLYGWEVTDCVVTLTHAGYWSVPSTAADFRNLTPLVLMQALARAEAAVCEPIETLDLVVPEDAFGVVSGALVAARGTIRRVGREDASLRIACDLPTAELRSVEQALPGLTHGDGEWISTFSGYAPVVGDPPTRPRVGPNPLHREQYLATLAGAYGALARR